MITTKRMIAKPNKHGLGIDIGWRVFDNNGFSDDIYWGNTRDGHSLASVINDAEKHGYEFIVDETVASYLDPTTARKASG